MPYAPALRRARRVKIVATLGPASNTGQTIEALVRSGADVLRINMSHTSHDMLDEMVIRIREVEERLGYPIGILVDLQGPKLRIGRFAEGSVNLVAGQKFILDGEETPGDAARVCLPHREVLDTIAPGHRLLLDDGKFQLKTLRVLPGLIETEIVYGGRLSDRKGVSLPDTMLPIGALTDKDHADLTAGLSAGADWIALSFVQRPDDVIAVRKIVRGRAGIMAKIEKPQAIEHIDEILRYADALMVARGDLGVELPLESVPGLQKRLVRLARQAGKPVVVATQMLESMISAPVPTRAEVSDVSIAVFEGADAIMLSAESASGQYPIEATAVMDRIAATVESDHNYRPIIRTLATPPEATASDAISAATRQVAETLNLPVIVTFTSSGFTAIRMARERSERPVLALSSRVDIVRRLTLVWGLVCIQTGEISDIENLVTRACAIVHRYGFADTGKRIAVTCGLPLGTPGSTNILRIATVELSEASNPARAGTIL